MTAKPVPLLLSHRSLRPEPSAYPFRRLSRSLRRGLLQLHSPSLIAPAAVPPSQAAASFHGPGHVAPDSANLSQDRRGDILVEIDEVGIPFADLGKNIGPLACTATHILSKDVEFPGMLQFWMNGLQRTHGLGQGRRYPVSTIRCCMSEGLPFGGVGP